MALEVQARLKCNKFYLNTTSKPLTVTTKCSEFKLLPGHKGFMCKLNKRGNDVVVGEALQSRALFVAST